MSAGRLVRAFVTGLAIVALCGLVHAQSPEHPRVGFIGTWDRAMPMLDDSARELGMTVAFWRADEIIGQDPKARDAAQACDFLFVLNISAEEAGPLRDVIRSIHAAKPSLKVVPLDKRDSQTDLDKAQLLTHDEEIPKYWRANGAINLKRMLRYTLVTYLDTPGTIEPAVLIPDFGYYDPDSEEPFETFDAYRDFKRSHGRWIESGSVAALLIQQSFWVTHDTKVVDAQVRALEARRINPVVIFADRESMVTDLLKAAHPDLVVEDRHGSMWDSRALLEELDAPYLRPISMLAYTVDEWKADPAGLATRDVGMFMTLQESWGTIEPIVVGGMAVNISGFQLHEPVEDGVDKFARRASSWLNLRKKPNADKKLAIIYYNKDLGKDDLMRGSPTGAFLDGPESFQRLVPHLKKDGYTITNEPPTTMDLLERIRDGARNVAPWAQKDLEEMVEKGHPALVPVSKYLQWFNAKLSPANREAVIKAFGPPPGKFMTIQRNGESFIVVPRIEMGNVILVPQPERGEKQDDTLLHSRDVPPPHNYLAFYWWLQEEYGADAIAHWGTHGSLELLPGKEAGLSSDSWGDILVGNMPVIDLWITDNIAEATLARRRSYAVLSDHLPPPALKTTLSETLRNLSDDANKFRALESGALKEEFRKRISGVARQERLDEILKLEHGSRPYADADIRKIDAYVQALSEEQTPITLHVLGEPMARKEEPGYLVSILGKSFLEHVAAAVPGADRHPLSDTEGRAWLRQQGEALLNATLFEEGSLSYALSRDLEKDLTFARTMLGRLNDTQQEITGLLRAFDGRYMTPGPGPDPIRNPESAPGGRNLYSLNPEEIPTQASWNLAVQLVDELLRMRKPKKVGMDLNGMNTMRDFGVMEAQILYLMGVRPVWDRNGLAVDVELIPRAELKRPRVDVFIAMGGQYKENFPTRVELLDKAVRLAASADEPDNSVRLGTLENQRKLVAAGVAAERAEQLAPARIFGTKQGNMSGTNILYLVPRSGVWDRDSDVADVYIDNMSWVYTKGAWGQKIDGLYRQAIQGTDTVLHVWASNMTSELSNHHSYEYLGGLSMAVKKLTGREPEAFTADVRSVEGARMREFNEVLATNLKTELLNAEWIKGMKEHGYAGAGHAAELVKNTFGWSVTRDDAISDATWKEIYSTYVEDKLNLGVREWMDTDNPHALQEIAATMLEASRKGYWKTDAATLNNLATLYRDSVAKHGESNGLVSGGNRQLEEYVGRHLDAPGNLTAAPKAAPNSASAPGAAAAAAGPSPASTVADAAVKVAGQVLAPVSRALTASTPSERTLGQALIVSAVSFVGFGLFCTGFVRRQGSL